MSAKRTMNDVTAFYPTSGNPVDVTIFERFGDLRATAWDDEWWYDIVRTAKGEPWQVASRKPRESIDVF
jgi:hypothetical protein